MPTPTTDFSIFDGQELVSYSALSGPTVDDIPTLRRPLTQSRQRNVERYVTLESTDVVFHLEGEALESVELVAGDTIVDATSQTYTVMFVERQTLGNIVVVVGRPTP